MDKTIAHLGFIQGVINRMAGNSFLLKGWSATLVTGLFALSAAGSDRRFCIIAIGIIIFFWLLDAYFLHLEKLYRALYSSVATGVISSDHFTLDYNLVKDCGVDTYCKVLVNATLILFYGPIFLSIIGVMVFLAKQA